MTSIPMEGFQHLVDSMPRRIEALWAKGGGDGVLYVLYTKCTYLGISFRKTELKFRNHTYAIQGQNSLWYCSSDCDMFLKHEPNRIKEKMSGHGVSKVFFNAQFNQIKMENLTAKTCNTQNIYKNSLS